MMNSVETNQEQGYNEQTRLLDEYAYGSSDDEYKTHKHFDEHEINSYEFEEVA